MATDPLRPNAGLVTLPGTFPPMPAVARVLSRHGPASLAAFVTIAIDLLDLADGDPDSEPNGDDEPLRADGDCNDSAWPEWHTLRGSMKRQPAAAIDEDMEDDDPTGQYDEDCYTGPLLADLGPGCPLSDPGEYEDGF